MGYFFAELLIKMFIIIILISYLFLYFLEKLTQWAKSFKKQSKGVYFC